MESKIVISDGFKAAETFVNRLPETFDTTGTMLYNKRNVVKSFNVGGTTLIVKKFKRPNIIQRVSYTFFKKSKAERAYIFAKMLRDRGIGTPREVAYIEVYDGLLMSDSYFVSLPCFLPSLKGLLRREDFDKPVAAELAGFIAMLHNCGVLHGDLNFSNILYEKDSNGHYKFVLIDTNRSKFRKPSYHDCIENLKRLTHERLPLKFILNRYALVRGWNPDKVTADVMHSLQRFEQRCDRKKRMKDLKKMIRIK